MPAPTPNGPTLNDLKYGSYNQAGYVNVTQTIPGQFIGGATTPVFDAINTRENVVLVLSNITYAEDTSDFLNTAENVSVFIDVFGLDNLAINTSDSTVTSENVVRA